MKVEIATATFDDGTETPCLAIHENGEITVLTLKHARTLAALEAHDLDAYQVVMDTAEAFLERRLTIGMEA